MSGEAGRLPDGLESYKRTARFTESTVPAALLRDHRTKEGTWGLIHVEQGRLIYRVTDPARPASERILSPADAPGIVEPAIAHHVEPIGEVAFWVEFFRAAAVPAPLCRYEELAERENRARADVAAEESETRSADR